MPFVKTLFQTAQVTISCNNELFLLRIHCILLINLLVYQDKQVHVQLLGNFTNVFMGKYHLTSPKNDTYQQQQYTAIPPKTTDFSNKYLLRFSWFISRSSVSWQTGCFKPQNLSGAERSGWNGSMWGRGSPLAGAHCHSPLRKRGDLGVPFSFNTPRYFWCGKLPLLPKKILHLFLSIQISVIWNLKSNLGYFFPQRQYFWQMGKLLTSSSVENNL